MKSEGEPGAPGIGHGTAECTGHWRREASAWRCTRCGIGYPLTRDVARAAIGENAFGLLLRHLTAEGRAAIEGTAGE